VGGHSLRREGVVEAVVESGVVERAAKAELDDVQLKAQALKAKDVGLAVAPGASPLDAGEDELNCSCWIALRSGSDVGVKLFFLR